MHWLLLFFVVLVSAVSVVVGTRKGWPREIYYFVGFSLLLLASIYGVTVLNWEIVGSEISVKKQKEEVLKAKNEVSVAKTEVDSARKDILNMRRQLVFISTSTIELTDMAAKCASRFGGCVGDSKKEIAAKQKRLLDYIEEMQK